MSEEKDCTALGFCRIVFDTIPGIALVSAVLAIIFGVLAFFDDDETREQGWLDITKIFAGAVVGASGVPRPKSNGT